MLIDIKSPDDYKKIVEEIEDIISNLKDRMKEMNEKEKKRKMWMRH